MLEQWNDNIFLSVVVSPCRSVQTLARMALKDPEHIGVSESRREMPNKLKQSYIVTDLGQKVVRCYL